MLPQPVSMEASTQPQSTTQPQLQVTMTQPSTRDQSTPTQLPPPPQSREPLSTNSRLSPPPTLQATSTGQPPEPTQSSSTRVPRRRIIPIILPPSPQPTSTNQPNEPTQSSSTRVVRRRIVPTILTPSQSSNAIQPSQQSRDFAQLATDHIANSKKRREKLPLFHQMGSLLEYNDSFPSSHVQLPPPPTRENDNPSTNQLSFIQPMSTTHSEVIDGKESGALPPDDDDLDGESLDDDEERSVASNPGEMDDWLASDTNSLASQEDKDEPMSSNSNGDESSSSSESSLSSSSIGSDKEPSNGRPLRNIGRKELFISAGDPSITTSATHPPTLIQWSS